MISSYVEPSPAINSNSSPIRSRSKSQKAMQAVLGADANHKTETQLAKESGVDRSYINMARAVQQYMPDEIDAIIDGRTSLAASYITVKARKAVLEAAAKPTPQELRERSIDQFNLEIWSQIRRQ
jgi:hypothetical protein